MLADCMIKKPYVYLFFCDVYLIGQNYIKTNFEGILQCQLCKSFMFIFLPGNVVSFDLMLVLALKFL